MFSSINLHSSYQVSDIEGHGFLPTGIEHLDRLLHGGIPRGKITEIVGARGSGKTSLLFSILAQTTSNGEIVAYVDSHDSLDPSFAEKAGIDLRHLLWIRCPNSTQWLQKAFKAADILARAGGYSVLALDLEPPYRSSRTAQQISFSSWYRLKRIIEGTPTLLLVLDEETSTGSASSIVISLQRRQIQWKSTTRDSDRSAPCKWAHLFQGIWSEVHLVRGKQGHAKVYSHF